MIAQQETIERFSRDMETEWIEAGSLFVDTEYQRVLNLPRVRKIAREWDDYACGTLVVNVRDDGRLAVVDGQHRLHAFLIAHDNDRKIPCTVVYGLTVAQEARLFAMLNGENRRQPRPMDTFRSRLRSETDEAANRIYAIIRELGLELNFTAGGTRRPEMLTSIAAIEGVWKRGGDEGLRQTLALLRDVWRNQERGAYTAQLIEGTFNFLTNYADEDIDRDLLVEKLAQYQPVVIQRRAAAKTDAATGSHGTKNFVAQVITDIYNQGKRSRKLDAIRKLTQNEVKDRWQLTE